ncbi:MAG: B12-binding domain-containing radical SAM protein [Lachnospiraceae bacterium]|nr:B12-binding domain-containing radical SAM protein [Lachnospiraceae bacterium]
MIKKWLLLNPPTGKYIRDTRCQASVDEIFAVSERAPVDLAYIAGAIANNGNECIIIDYSAEKLSWLDMLNDLKILHPDYVVINTTMFSYADDLAVCSACKDINNNIITIAKGAIFFYEPLMIMRNYVALDIAVAHEEENAFNEISLNTKTLSEIRNIIYREKGNIIKNPSHINAELILPTPLIQQIKHELYKRPDTDEMQASITIGRGCSGKCIYCIAPLVGGAKVRYRAIHEVIEEIKLYYYNYGINNFYFSADTFIWNHDWVKRFCEEICKLDFKISWLCTARADLISSDILSIIKDAGCWGLSIGIESGSETIQKLIKKNLSKSTVENAIKLCRNHKIVTLLHFMIGFPWDNENTIKDTIRFANKLKGNIVEFYMTTPMPGTELYEIFKNDDRLKLSLDDKVMNQNKTESGTLYLTANQLTKLRKKALRSVYLNPFFYANSLKYITSFSQLINCARFICKKLYNIVIKKQITESKVLCKKKF